MKVAYLVLAHDAPAQLGRLVSALSSPTSKCFVHLDAKSDLSQFQHLEGRDVCLTPDRVPVIWGHYSQVEAILVLLRTAFDDPAVFERFVLISGTDHPVRSAPDIERFFELHADREFMNLAAVPDESLGKPITRLTTYQPRPRQGAVGGAVWKLMIGVGRRVHRRDYERHLNGLAPFAGSTWWALTRAAGEHLLTFVSREPRFVAFFRHVVSPDESFFQTILGNSDFASRTEPNLTYTDWSAGGANPATMCNSHLEVLAGDHGDRDYLFARKFSDADHEIVARLDRLIADQDRDASGEVFAPTSRLADGRPSPERREVGADRPGRGRG